MPLREEDALTINQAAATTGWSPRMLRYIERAGLVAPARSDGGYRLYRAAELQRLGTLRELLHEFGIELAEVGFAARLQQDDRLRAAIERWLSAPAQRPEEIAQGAWLSYEQSKHQRLLAEIAGVAQTQAGATGDPAAEDLAAGDPEAEGDRSAGRQVAGADPKSPPNRTTTRRSKRSLKEAA